MGEATRYQVLCAKLSCIYKIILILIHFCGDIAMDCGLINTPTSCTHIYICPSILPLITHAGTATCAQVPGEEDSGPGICQLFQMAKNCGVISYELGSRVCAKPRYVRLGGDLVEPQCGNFRGGPIYVGDIQPRHVRVPWQLRRV